MINKEDTKKKINHFIITGVTGWLGYHFLESLIKGTISIPKLNLDEHQLTCLVEPGSETTKISQLSSKIDIIKGDISNPDTAQQLLKNKKDACVIHIAGVIHPKKIIDFYTINLKGTTHLVKESLKNKISRFVYISSNSPIGCNPYDDHLFDETTPYNPYMNYGKSKMMAEKAILEITSQNDIESVIIRPPWFYGTNQPPRQSLFFSMVKNGKFPIVGSGRNQRSMVNLDNLCQGLYLASTHPNAANNIYWIADETPYSMTTIITTIQDVLEELNFPVNRNFIKLPFIIGQIAEFTDASLQYLGAYNQKIHVLSEMNKTIACSIEKAKKELGYSPTISLREGMKKSIQWCIDQNIKI